MPTPRDVRTPARAFLDFFFSVEPSVTLATSTGASATGIFSYTGVSEATSGTRASPVVSVPEPVPVSPVPPSPEGGVVGDVTRFLTER